MKNPAKNARFSDRQTGLSDYSRSELYTDLTRFRSLVMSMQYGTLVLPSVKYHVISLATKQSKTNDR